MIWRHLHPDLYRDEDVVSINHYYAEAVNAPIYYGYSGPGTFSDRRQRARAWDAELLRLAPDTVLVLVSASADAIRERMRRRPGARDILRAKDVPLVLDRVREEYDASLVRHKLALDTTTAAAEETLVRFLEQMRPLMSHADRLRRLIAPAHPE